MLIFEVPVVTNMWFSLQSEVPKMVETITETCRNTDGLYGNFRIIKCMVHVYGNLLVNFMV